jgi:integral membrane sensor domain MASE1
LSKYDVIELLELA